MGIKLSPEYLKRYKDIAMLLVKYGDSDLVKHAGLDEVLDENGGPSQEAPAKAEELAKDLEKLGPAFVKLGQLFSTRADLLPPAYLVALSRLQDDCEPISFAEVEKTVVTELGVRISRAFKEFDSVPLAAASLGQIHRAVMRDGREVAVKVQRPGIRECIVADLEVLHDVAQFYDANTEAGKKYEFRVIVDEFRKTLMAELDYRKEGQNLDTLRRNIEDYELIKVPEHIPDYTTSKVLTMEFIKGKKVTGITKLELTELDGGPLAEAVFAAYLKQILVDGFFHADPHPGNVLLTEDKRVALLDLGMVARLTPQIQGKLLQLVLAISESRPDSVANIAVDIGEPKDGFDELAFRKQVGELVQNDLNGSVKDMQVGKVVLGITKAAGDCGIRVPAELTMLGKALFNLDEIGRNLDPTFNPNASVRKNAVKIMQMRMLANASPGHMFNSLIETKDLIESIPSNIRKVVDLVANNRLQIKVIDEPILIDAAQKLANRISLALILAALIIGAALLMRVETRFTILGYPGLAIICFLAAATGGAALAIQIAFYDQRPKNFKKYSGPKLSS